MRNGSPKSARCAKNELGFDYLVDISSVDNYGDDPRWTVVYHLRGSGHGSAICGSRPT